MLSGVTEPLLDDFAVRGTLLLYFCAGHFLTIRSISGNRRSVIEPDATARPAQSLDSRL
jgi:hypothetical protein